MSKTLYIYQLPEQTQQAIYRQLKRVVKELELITDGMNGRLSDLENTINIKKYLH